MNKNVVIGLLVVLTVLFGFFAFQSGGLSFGKASGPSHFQHESFLQGLSAGVRDAFTISNTGAVTIGTNGGTMNEVKATTGNFIGMNASQAASTTVPYDIAVPGVVSGDMVLAQLSTTTQNAITDGKTATGPWSITSCVASSTAGYVTCMVHNGGLAAVPSATRVGSSTNVLYIDF